MQSEKDHLKNFGNILAEDFKKYGKIIDQNIVLDSGLQSQKIGSLKNEEMIDPTNSLDVFRKKNPHLADLVTLDHRFELSEEEFKALEDPYVDLNKIRNKEKSNETLKEAYLNIIDLLKKYCDLNEGDYPIVATWIIGTYFHKEFHSYPYLFLNAMKGSGKTRTLKLITDLSYDGEILLQPTEAVLFRTNSTLGIDEAEGLTRKGFENIRELLNGCYKKGSKVKRMKQKRTFEGTEQVVEEFDIYRPLVIANISGMEDVLGDRCINIILERSSNPKIIKLAEIWKQEKLFNDTKLLLSTSERCSLCSCNVVCELYTRWNDFILNNYINYTNSTNYTNYTNYTQLFKSLNLMDLTGREVELCLPLMFIAWEISPEVYEKLHNSIKNYMSERKQDQFNESRDVMVLDFVSQETELGFQSVKVLCDKFLQFTQEDNKDNEINSKWIGWALRRLKLIKEKKRQRGGSFIKLDIEKAQENLKKFK